VRGDSDDAMSRNPNMTSKDRGNDLYNDLAQLPGFFAPFMSFGHAFLSSRSKSNASTTGRENWVRRWKCGGGGCSTAVFLFANMMWIGVMFLQTGLALFIGPEPSSSSAAPSRNKHKLMMAH